MPSKLRLRKCDGFLLVEALPALVILTLALAALPFGDSGATRNNERAVFVLQATR